MAHIDPFNLFVILALAARQSSVSYIQGTQQLLKTCILTDLFPQCDRRPLFLGKAAVTGGDYVPVAFAERRQAQRLAGTSIPSPSGTIIALLLIAQLEARSRVPAPVTRSPRPPHAFFTIKEMDDEFFMRGGARAGPAGRAAGRGAGGGDRGARRDDPRPRVTTRRSPGPTRPRTPRSSPSARPPRLPSTTGSKTPRST